MMVKQNVNVISSDNTYIRFKNHTAFIYDKITKVNTTSS